MGWWRRRRSKQPPPEPQGPEPETHGSPAFEALTGWLETVPKPRILDLGSAAGPNLDYFAGLSARLQVVNLFDALEEIPGGPARREQAAEDVFREVLPAVDVGGYDAVLVWDLLNYLSRRQMRALGAHLGQLTRPGGRLLTLVSNLPRVPDHPATFRIVDGSTLAYSGQSEPSRSNPRWPPGEVQKAFGDFTVERSFLLRHGIQEFLFVRTDPSPPPDAA